MTRDVNHSRRSFLRGKFRHSPSAPIRPPWSKSESIFVQNCTRCDKCIESCPEGIIVHCDGGLPQIDFNRGACTFCQDCVKACEEGCFEPLDTVSWHLQHRFTDSCISLQGITCRSCEDICPTQAISFKLKIGGKAQPVMDDELCTYCGACLACCPVEGINLFPTQEDRT